MNIDWRTNLGLDSFARVYTEEPNSATSPEHSAGPSGKRLQAQDSTN